MPSPDLPAAPAKRLRVVVQQPSLGKYRVPVFRELARRPGIELLVSYGCNPALPNAEPDGFAATPSHERVLPLGPRSLRWEHDQWRFASRKHCDVLIMSGNVQYASMTAAILRARAEGVRTLLWTHGYSKDERLWRKTIRDRVYALADGLILYGHRPAQRYLDEGWDPRRIFVALNAIDQEPIQAARSDWLSRPDDLAAFRQQHDLAHGPVVLFVSRLDPANRLDLLIRAAPALTARHPHLRIVIIGKGDTETQRLTAIATSLGVARHVRFIGPVYDEAQLAPWFLSADVFCYPANIGLSILHAFGYGVPVVTSDNIASQNPEIEALLPGENGLLFTDGDSEALSESLRRIISDRSLRDHLADSAHTTAQHKFTLTNMVDGVISALTATAGAPSPKLEIAHARD